MVTIVALIIAEIKDLNTNEERILGLPWWHSG